LFSFQSFFRITWKNRESFVVPENVRKIVKNILISMPNLKFAELVYLDEDLARFISKNLKQLKEVKSCYIAQLVAFRENIHKPPQHVCVFINF
jgi:hypothetical protein